MSKIGKLPIEFKENIQVAIEGNTVNIKSPNGQVNYLVPNGITAVIEEGKLVLKAKNIKDRAQRALYGLTRANLGNIVKGLDTGFEKKLEIQGVGYRAQVQGVDLTLSLGFSHPVKFHPADGVKLAVAENIITVSGTDKALVGLTASKIRGIKPPEPYKGKGIRYKGEVVKRKVGKAAKAVGSK